MHREDAFCPACPDPETAFRLKDIGIKFGYIETTDGGMRIRASRPLWETVMLDHLRLTDDDEHRRVYGQCVAALMLAGVTAEQAARSELQALTDSVNRSIRAAMWPAK